MPGNNWELLQNPSPNSPFGAQYGAAGLALPDPSGRPPPTEDQLTNAGVKALETSSVPITLGGRYPTPGQPIPVPGAPGMPAPLPEVSLQGGDPNAMGPIARRMGFGMGFKVPSSVDEINAHMEGAQPWVTKVNGISRPNEKLGNEGLNLMHDANAEGAAAQRATAGVAEKGAEELSKISGDRAKIYEGAAPIERTANEDLDKEIDATKTKMNEDNEWIRTHSRVDPYRTFTTNAGSGILALLGTALMAGGASVARDSSLNWTKQVDSALDREAESQLRMLQNKKWSVTEAGQNMKRIAQTSADAYEARARFRMQGLQALNERAEQIKNTTESNSVRSRAEAIIAQNKQKLGEELANVAIRQQALRSGENVAALQAGVAKRGQDMGLFGQFAGNVSAYNAAQRAAEKDAYKPIAAQVNELKKTYGAARSAAQRYYDALVSGAPSQRLNELSSVFSDAYSKYASGGTQSAQARNAIQTYGVPRTSAEFFGKFKSQKNAKDLANLIRDIDRSFQEQKGFILDASDTWHGAAAPPTNAAYSSDQ